jgi:hypothetical protein
LGGAALLVAGSLTTLDVQAQFPESFDGATFPPTSWARFETGPDATQQWVRVTSPVNSGAGAAQIRFSAAGATNEDFLATPQFTPTAGTTLDFYEREAFGANYGSTFSVRVSTTSQTTPGDFTTIWSRGENGSLIYSLQSVDLSAYAGTPIYVAFVSTNNDGDTWRIDDVNVVAPPSACDNSTAVGNCGQWPGGTPTVDPGGAVTSIATNNYTSGEYSQVQGIVAGNDYEFTIASGGYVTVYQDGVNTTLLGAGLSPLTVTALTTGNLFAHWTEDASCAITCAGNVATTVQYLVPPPCDNSTAVGNCGQWPGGTPTVDPGGAVTTISTNNYTSGEYSQVQGIVAGNDYEFTIASGGYVTVYQDGVNTTFLGAGSSPLTVTALTSGNMYAHWTENSSCDITCAGSVATTVQRILSCTLPSATASIEADCGNSQFFVDVDLTGLGDASTVDIVENVNGGGEVVVHNDVSTLQVYQVGPYALGANVNVRVVHNGNNTCDLDLGAFTFAALDCPAIVTCGTPLNETHCYNNNDATTWSWSSSLGSPLTLTFNAGTMESCCDVIIIRNGLDNTGAILYSGNNGGNLTGLTVSSPSGNIFMEIDADGSWSCVDGVGGPYTVLDWDLTCPSCFAPVASATVVPACPGGFSVDVNITDFGSGSSATINYSVNSVPQTPVAVGSTGITTLSGFANGADVDITVEHESDPACNVTLNNNTFICPPANDLCADAIAINCNSVVTGSTTAANHTGAPTASCDNTGDAYIYNAGGRGVWYTVQGWDGPMTASLCGSSFDTQIWVGTTADCVTLNCVAGNDDAFALCTSSGANSIATWTGSSATTYHIYVTGWGTAFGDYTLSVSCGDNNALCTENGLTLEFQTDGAPFETTWEIRNEAGTVVASNGGPLNAPNGIETQFGCVPDGCYTLRVLDSAGDGMTTGGYILRTQGSNERIIDNRNNFNTGTVSAISGGQGFCLPMSSDKVIFTSCDKLDWINGQYVVATPNAAVSAEWIPNGANNVQDNNSGYEFWIFDPNGSYSFRRFRSHNISDGFGPASATRAAHMKLNNWGVASQVPANVLMNVRVRARINGLNGEFGPACRLEINPVLAACPQTNLMDIPDNQYFSCGATRQWGTGNFVHARPVSGANRYQFRFRIPAEGFEVVRTATTYFTQLNWAVLPLQDGKTYDVDVRVSKDGGATWCSTSDPWGNVCLLTIDNTPANSGNQNFAAEGAAAELRMFPNPNRGDVLNFSLSAIEEGVSTVSVDIYDLTGKRMSARTIAVADGNVNTVLNLNGELAAGMYVVNITAGETLYTERLVIQP